MNELEDTTSCAYYRLVGARKPHHHSPYHANATVGAPWVSSIGIRMEEITLHRPVSMLAMLHLLTLILQAWWTCKLSVAGPSLTLSTIQHHQASSNEIGMLFMDLQLLCDYR